MPYRVAASATPRTLVVRPQRAKRSLGFLIFGTGMTLPIVLFMGANAIASGASAVGLGIMVLAAAVPCWFAIVGVRAWLLRVELAAFDADDMLTMTLVAWPRAPRVVSLSLSDVRDVAVQSNDEGSERLALIAAKERLPLTETFTADDLTGKAREMRHFLRLADLDRVTVQRI